MQQVESGPQLDPSEPEDIQQDRKNWQRVPPTQPDVRVIFIALGKMFDRPPSALEKMPACTGGGGIELKEARG